MKEIIWVIVAVAIAILLLSVRIILKKGGKFSSEHISSNKRMRQDGIRCATSQDREARRAKKTKLDVKEL
jgi:hypothetical protein